MVVSAVVLLAVTGPGPDALRIMLAPQSWLVGIGTIGMEVFYYILLEHVAPAHGSLLVRLAIPLSMVIGWVLFARRPPRLAMIGAGVVFLGDRAAVCSPSMPSTAPRRPAAGIASALAFDPAQLRRRVPSLESARHDRDGEAAHHRPGGARYLARRAWCWPASSPRSIGRGRAAADQHDADACLRCCMGRPSCSAWLVGSSVLTAMAVLSFSAVVKITTENLTAAHAFTPVATLLVQMAASAVGLIPLTRSTPACCRRWPS